MQPRAEAVVGRMERAPHGRGDVPRTLARGELRTRPRAFPVRDELILGERHRELALSAERLRVWLRGRLCGILREERDAGEQELALFRLAEHVASGDDVEALDRLVPLRVVRAAPFLVASDEVDGLRCAGLLEVAQHWEHDALPFARGRDLQRKLMALARPVDEAQREPVRALRRLHPERQRIDVYGIDAASHLDVVSAACEVRREGEGRTPLRRNVRRRAERPLRARELLAASERPPEHRLVGVDQRHIRRGGCEECGREQCRAKCNGMILHAVFLSRDAAILPQSASHLQTRQRTIQQ